MVLTYSSSSCVWSMLIVFNQELTARGYQPGIMNDKSRNIVEESCLFQYISSLLMFEQVSPQQKLQHPLYKHYLNILLQPWTQTFYKHTAINVRAKQRKSKYCLYISWRQSYIQWCILPLQALEWIYILSYIDFFWRNLEVNDPLHLLSMRMFRAGKLCY